MAGNKRRQRQEYYEDDIGNELDDLLDRKGPSIYKKAFDSLRKLSNNISKQSTQTAKNLDLLNADLTDLSSNIEKYSAYVKNEYLKGAQSRYKKYSMSLDTQILKSPSIKKEIKDAIRSQKGTIKTKLDTGDMKGFMSAITELRGFINKEVTPSKRKQTEQSAYKTMFGKIDEYGKEMDVMIENTKIYAKETENINRILNKASEESITKFMEGLETIPFIGTAMTKVGASRKLQEIMTRGFSKSIEKTQKKAQMGKGAGMFGMPMGGVGMAGALVGIAALGWILSKVVEEFQDFRESMKGLAEGMKTTELSTIKYAWAAEKASLALRVKYAYMPEKKPMGSEVSQYGLAVSETLRRKSIMQNSELLKQFGSMAVEFKMSAQEIANFAKMMEQMGQSSDKQLVNMRDYMSVFSRYSEEALVNLDEVMANAQDGFKLFNRYGKQGIDQFAKLAVNATKYGMSLEDLYEKEKEIVEFDEFMRKATSLNVALKNAGIGNVNLDMRKMQDAAIRGRTDQLMDLIVDFSVKLDKEYQNMLSKGMGQTYQTNALRTALEGFGMPIDYLTAIAQKHASLPTPDQIMLSRQQEVAKKLMYKSTGYNLTGQMGLKFGSEQYKIDPKLRDFVEGKTSFEQLPTEKQAAINAEMNNVPTTISTQTAKSTTTKESVNVSLDDKSVKKLGDEIKNMKMNVNLYMDGGLIGKAQYRHGIKIGAN